ncbi:MAG: helix-hairpin-helix domain-containing protein [Crocinitomicaceae bacterium]
MKNRFEFSKAEKVGVAILSILILILLVFLNTPRMSYMPDVFISDTSHLTYIYPEKNFTSKKKKNHYYKESKIKYEHFNPNSYGATDWMKIGFSVKQAKVIVSYKNRINGFSSIKDLESCYVISERKMNEMRGFLKFTDLQKDTIVSDEQIIQLVELNRSSKSDLENVSGIGPYFAKNIIELREKLGGFYAKEQVKEVYGMTLEYFDRMKAYLTVDATLITQLLISECSFSQLRRHPYLNWKQSQIITDLENKIVNPEFWDTLSTFDAFKKSDIIRLKPYLK